MSLVTATTAPDFRPVRADLTVLDAEPGVRLELLVLAADGARVAGVDLATGVLVRACAPHRPERRPRPYDVVAVTVTAERDALPEPTDPETLLVDDAPVPAGRLTGRRAERLLRPLLHPSDAPLLSSAGPTVPLWERRADHPSLALAQPDGPVVLHRLGGWLGCLFEWQGSVRELPCLDRRVAAVMDRAGLSRMVADRRSRLLVSLAEPVGGHCRKVVEAVLPRP